MALLVVAGVEQLNQPAEGGHGNHESHVHQAEDNEEGHADADFSLNAGCYEQIPGVSKADAEEGDDEGEDNYGYSAEGYEHWPLLLVQRRRLILPPR